MHKVLHLIETNETLPDIEKLDRSEFILDLEEHQKHQNEEAELIAKVNHFNYCRAFIVNY